MDRGTWRVTAHTAAKHWTQLKWLSMHAQFIDTETETQAAVSNHHNFMAQKSRDGVWTHLVWFQSQLSQILHCDVSQDVWLIPWFPILATGQVSYLIQFSSVQFSHSVVFDSLRPRESQHARPPCPSPTPGVYSNSCPSSRWCHPAISSSVVPFSSCPQSLLASGSFPMSYLIRVVQNSGPMRLFRFRITKI